MYHDWRYKKRYGVFIFFIICLLWWARSSPSYAQSIEESCGTMSLTIAWNTLFTSWTVWLFHTISNSILDEQATIEYELRWSHQDTPLAVTQQREFSYIFSQTGTYLLKAILRRSENCMIADELPIQVIDHLWVSLWLSPESKLILQHLVRSKNTELLPLQLQPTETTNTVSQSMKYLAEILPMIDVLVVDTSQSRLFFDHIDDFLAYTDTLPDTIILVGNLPMSALRRLIKQSPDIRTFSEIITTTEPYITVAAQAILLKQPLNTIKTVRVFHPDGRDAPFYLPMSKIVDTLLSTDVSVWFIIYLLLIPLLILILVIAKQVGWLQIGGVYYLLFLVGVLQHIGRELTLIIWWAARAWQTLMYIITKKIYLLYAPKVWLALTATIFFMFLGFRGVTLLFPDAEFFSFLDEGKVFFPTIALSLIMQYIYPDLKAMQSRSRRTWLIQLVVYSRLAFLFINTYSIQQFVLWYPDISLVSIVMLIIVGRYTGLQLTEYLRFRPLIKNQISDEDE